MAGSDGSLILVAESGGPTMFARIGVMRALNRHIERVFNPIAKTTIGESGSWRANVDVGMAQGNGPSRGEAGAAWKSASNEGNQHSSDVGSQSADPH